MKPVCSKLPVNEIQTYLAINITLHPHVYHALLEKIMELQYQGLACAVPLTLLDNFYFKSLQRLRRVG